MNNCITAVILTYNEAKHIERCIRSVSGVADEVWVVDSFSSDDTCKIAERLGAMHRLRMVYVDIEANVHI